MNKDRKIGIALYILAIIVVAAAIVLFAFHIDKYIGVACLIAGFVLQTVGGYFVKRSRM